MDERIDIPALFKSVAERVNTYFSGRPVDPFDVYFAHGHYDAVNKDLIDKDGGTSTKNAKFPLIWMVTPFDQRFDKRYDYYCELSGLDFLFLMNSSYDETIDQRIENYYKPRLWPIVERFKIEIDNSGLFYDILSPESIPYEYIKDWYFNGNLGGKGNLFNDFIDAVQIKGLRLRINETVPEGFQIH